MKCAAQHSKQVWDHDIRQVDMTPNLSAMIHFLCVGDVQYMQKNIPNHSVYFSWVCNERQRHQRRKKRSKAHNIYNSYVLYKWFINIRKKLEIRRDILKRSNTMMPSKEYKPFFTSTFLPLSFSYLQVFLAGKGFFFFPMKHPSTLMSTTHCGCQTLIHTFSLIFFLFLYLSLHCSDSRHLCARSCSQLLSLGVTCWAKEKK